MDQDSLFGSQNPGSPRPGQQSGHDSGAFERFSGEDLFERGAQAPLAARMRPESLDDVVGQEHLLGPGKPLRRLVEGAGEASVILYGPPGTGKTTLASLIARQMGRNFVGMSALDSGVKHVREVITQARRDASQGTQTVLFLDEVHRFSKNQQDALLAAVENRTVLLVAATTENPSFSVVAPLLSRSLLLHLQPLSPDDIRTVIERALASEQGLQGQVSISSEALEDLVRLSGGDARRGLTYLEATAENARSLEPAEITSQVVADSIDKALVRYDRDGDQHYDVISAFIKSIRGSDVDAALHYLARMIEAGEDPRFIARRLVIAASEDIGMADPSSLEIAVAAFRAVEVIGLPEAKLTLAQAVIHLSTAPKSASVNQAITAALADVRAGNIGHVPAHLRDSHYSGAQRLGHGEGYKYPHDDPRGVVSQQYIPTELSQAVYYQPSEHGNESRIASYLGRLRRIIRGKN